MLSDRPIDARAERHATTGILRRACESGWTPRFSDARLVPRWAEVLVTVLFSLAAALALTAALWIPSGGRIARAAVVVTRTPASTCATAPRYANG
jgi:hypothetical protein